jgi:hypothetical protein
MERPFLHLTRDAVFSICTALRELIDSYPEGHNYTRQRKSAEDALYAVMEAHGVQWCARCEEFSMNQRPYRQDGSSDICHDCAPDHEWSSKWEPHD